MFTISTWLFLLFCCTCRYASKALSIYKIIHGLLRIYITAHIWFIGFHLCHTCLNTSVNITNFLSRKTLCDRGAERSFEDPLGYVTCILHICKDSFRRTVFFLVSIYNYFNSLMALFYVITLILFKPCKNTYNWH